MAPTAKKMTKARMAELMEWCEENSIPRPELWPPDPDRGKKKPLKALLPRLRRLCFVPLHYLQTKRINLDKLFLVKRSALKYKPTARIKKLAIMPKIRVYVRPSQRSFFPEKVFEVKKKALKYKPTERIKTLALPHFPYQKPRKEKPLVKRSALKYKATERITVLSKPRKNLTKPPKPVPNVISKAAKSATASARTSELAAPREYEDQTNPRAYNISKAALKYTATERIETLAKPKMITPKYVAAY